MAAAGGGAAPAAPAAPPPPACAACKYQRRRCSPECPLARYFPHDRPRVFRNAHRLFGVSNILKTLDRAGADPGRRHEAMQCVVYESQAWDLYPSAGCVPIIHGLQRRIRQAQHELRRVHAHLQAYRRDPDRDAASDAFMYGGGGAGDEQHMMIDNAAAVVTSDDGNAITAVARAPPPYEHPFFVNANATTPMLLPQLHYQQQPVVQLPELQDDMMNYFADRHHQQ